MPRAYRLSGELRQTLSIPLGRVFDSKESAEPGFRRLLTEASMLITVGDRVTETAGSLGRVPDIQVVDGLERRDKREPPSVPYTRLVEVKNPAGVLTAEAIAGMRDAFGGRKPVRVLVDGEEDLMALLAVGMAPVSAMVLYGQPGAGVVAVKVDGVSKSRNRALLAKMGIKRLA
ncbi:MAG: DUF359 domain-containing protein [Nitrososphaerota archaeon]|nr:DUF359 domain-containing protein [Nitrososphaerota archaeon]